MDPGSALTLAWERTRLLLFEHRSWGRWGTFALLTFLTGGGGGGGGSANLPMPPGGTDDRRSSDAAGKALAAASFAGLGGAEWALVLGIFVAVLVLVLVFGWLAGVARLVMTENIIHDRHALVEPFGRLAGLGMSSFLWLLGLALLVGGLLLLAVGLVGGGLYGAGLLNEDAWVPLLLVALLLGLPLLLVLGVFMAVVSNLHDEVVAPVMYLREMPATRAWGMLLPLLRQKWGSWLLYLVIRLAVAMGTAMVSLATLVLALLLVGSVVGLLVGLPVWALFMALESPAVLVIGAIVGLLLALPALLACVYAVATPMAVFARCYALASLGQCDPAYAVLGPPAPAPSPPAAPLGPEPAGPPPDPGLAGGPLVPLGPEPAGPASDPGLAEGPLVPSGPEPAGPPGDSEPGPTADRPTPTWRLDGD